MEVKTFSLIEGAKRAEGLTVVIDVFRAFSMECYLYALGAAEVRPAGSLEETFSWRKKDPGCVLVGERHGKRVEGCELGNSPSSVVPEMIRGKRVIHSTSAGTQGIVSAVHAGEILTGSFVNAGAVAEYIRRRRPGKVSLVPMGKEGLAPAEEDELCAAYLTSLLTGRGMPDIRERLESLRYGGGSHFFDPDRQDIYPEADFRMCVDLDRFDFVLRVERDALGLVSRVLRTG